MAWAWGPDCRFQVESSTQSENLYFFWPCLWPAISMHFLPSEPIKTPGSARLVQMWWLLACCKELPTADLFSAESWTLIRPPAERSYNFGSPESCSVTQWSSSSPLLTLQLSTYLILPGCETRTWDLNGRTQRAVTNGAETHRPHSPCCGKREGEKSCGSSKSPDLGAPEPGLWHPLWGSVVPGFSRLLGASVFPSSRCSCSEQKLGAVHLVHLQPCTEPAPVPVPGAAHPAVAASQPACLLCVVTRPCIRLPTHPLPLHTWLTCDWCGMQVGSASWAQPTWPSGQNEPSGRKQCSGRRYRPATMVSGWRSNTPRILWH